MKKKKLFLNSIKKLRLSIILFFIFFHLQSAYSQCVDVFDRPCDCPTENDSLIIYNNAIKVYEFYEKDPNYVRLKSDKLKTKKSVKDCFYQLQDAVDTFSNRFFLREQVLSGVDLPQVLLPRNGKNIPVSDYYLYIDDYRFYQREFESGILNTNSPFPMYDIRIAPLIINSYENRTSYDEFNGDFVNVVLYLPVTVKPYKLLTDNEKIIRKKILDGYVFLKPKTINNNSTQPNKKIILPKSVDLASDTTELSNKKVLFIPPTFKKNFTTPPPNAVPMYYYNSPGHGTLMGFLVGRKFRKYLPTDEFYWALPKWLKSFLDNDIELEKYLKLNLGSWYDGLYIK